ncbi:lysylphosphatidylglycerol synthase transmembrane domain-containing protein [Hydrogenobaculum acidophilum]
MKHILKAVVLFTFVAGFSIFYVVYKTFNKYTIDIIYKLNIRYILLALFFSFLYQTFDVLRLITLSKALNVRYSIFYGYMMSFINTFAATVSPLHIGGELASVYMLKRKGVHLHKTMSIVTMKTLSGMFFFVVAFPLTVFYLYQKPKLGLDVIKIFLISVGLGFLIYISAKLFFKSNILSNRRKLNIRYTLRKYIATLRIFLRIKKSSVFLAFFYSSMLYISFLCIGPILIKAFGKNVDIFKAMLRQLGLLYGIYMSPTPGGAGVGEIGGLEVFRAYLSFYELGLFVILWRFISQYLAAFIGWILFQIILIKDNEK